LLSDWSYIIVLAFALSLDAFSVSVAVAAAARSPRQTFRLSWHFGLFQFLMPMVGGFAGRGLSQWLDAYDHWISFAILMGIGLHMLYESFFGAEEELRREKDRSRGWTLIILSVATSLDALGAGFIIGLRFQPGLLVEACVTIGVIAGAMTFIGVRLGRKMGQKISRGSDILGGVVLVALGIWAVLS